LNPTLDERQRRLWAGAEAGAIGFGGVAAVARATGLAISTVRKVAMKVEPAPSQPTSSTCDAVPN
jgi:hypothetical protein